MDRSNRGRNHAPNILQKRAPGGHVCFLTYQGPEAVLYLMLGHVRRIDFPWRFAARHQQGGLELRDLVAEQMSRMLRCASPIMTAPG